MATAKNNSSKPTVRRIKATDSKKAAKKPSAKMIQPTSSERRRMSLGPLSKFFGYFKGAWFELKQVRWPNRQATWSMTAALLAFTAIFVVLILILDIAFEYLFKAIIG